MKTPALFLLLALIGAGCAVQGQPFQKAASPPGNAIIYVYRPYHYGSSLLRPPVSCGDETARIGPGGYHAFIVPTGEVTCSVGNDESNDATKLDADAHVYYIREEFGWGIRTGHPHLNPIDTDVAHDEIQTCCVDEAARAQ